MDPFILPMIMKKDIVQRFESYENGKKRIFLNHSDGWQEEITPICIHCLVKKNLYNCSINPKVVHCCGQCVGCKNYKAPPEQLTIF